MAGAVHLHTWEMYWCPSIKWIYMKYISYLQIISEKEPAAKTLLQEGENKHCTKLDTLIYIKLQEGALPIQRPHE